MKRLLSHGGPQAAAMQPALWFACMALPWLDPFARGPSSTVQPWLFSAFCAVILATAHGFGRPPLMPALVLAGLCAVASLGATSPLDLAALAGAGMVILLTASTAAGTRGRPAFVKAMARAWLAAALASSAIGLAQYFGWASDFDPWMSAASLGEAYANLRQRNQFASLTSIGLVALLWMVRGGLKPLHALPALLLLAAGNAASASRTGVLQWLLVMGYFALTAQRRKDMLVLAGAGALAYVAAGLALPALLEAATGVAGPSVFMRFVGSAGCSSRAVLWSNVADLIMHKPWTGWGWGELDYAHFMTLYPGERFCDILDNAHSLPLHLAVEAGIPVAVLVCGALAWILWRCSPVARMRDADSDMAWAVLAVILVHSLLEYPLWYGPFELAFGLCLGLMWPAPAARQPAPPATQGSLRLGVAAAALLAVGYAAWDYHRISQIYLPPEARASEYEDDTLSKLRASRLFRQQVAFAELTLTPLTRDNAQWTFDTANALLHYSPEPRVIRKAIESAVMLGRDAEAQALLARYRAAFAEDHAKWAQEFVRR